MTFAARFQARQDERVLAATTSGEVAYAVNGQVRTKRWVERLQSANGVAYRIDCIQPSPAGPRGNLLPGAPESTAAPMAELKHRELPVSVFRVPTSPGPDENFQLLNQWECTVCEIDESKRTFVAELRDLSEPTTDVEEATFLVDDVAAGDSHLLVPGAVFRWSIGYRHDPGGQRDRVSRLRFVRIPGWRRRDVEEIESAAREAYEHFVGKAARPSGTARA